MSGRKAVVEITRHKCSKTHANTRDWIKCAIGTRRVLWTRGRGRLAVVSSCGGHEDLTVSLHGSIASAWASLRELNRMRCGSSCTKDHFVAVVIP